MKILISVDKEIIREVALDFAQGVDELGLNGIQAEITDVDEVKLRITNCVLTTSEVIKLVECIGQSLADEVSLDDNLVRFWWD